MRGFSLIEVIFATAILAGAALALAGALVRSLPATIDAGRVGRAAILASQKIEQLRTAPAIQPAVELVAADGSVLGAGGTTSSAVFARRWSSTPLPGGIAAQLVTVTVETLSGAAEERVTTVGVIGAP